MKNPNGPRREIEECWQQELEDMDRERHEKYNRKDKIEMLLSGARELDGR